MDHRRGGFTRAKGAGVAVGAGAGRAAMICVNESMKKVVKTSVNLYGQVLGSLLRLIGLIDELGLDQRFDEWLRCAGEHPKALLSLEYVFAELVGPELLPVRVVLDMLCMP